MNFNSIITLLTFTVVVFAVNKDIVYKNFHSALSSSCLSDVCINASEEQVSNCGRSADYSVFPCICALSDGYYENLSKCVDKCPELQNVLDGYNSSPEALKAIYCEEELTNSSSGSTTSDSVDSNSSPTSGSTSAGRKIEIMGVWFTLSSIIFALAAFV